MKRRLLPPDYFHIAGEAGYYPALDGLRALAITLVLIRHWAVACREQFHVHHVLGAVPLSNICLNGWSGVDLFFTLSGFLVGSHLLRHTHARLNPGFIRTYFSRRALRILPLYVFSVFICAVGLVPYFDGGMDYFQFLVYCFFLQDYFGSPTLLPLWSLGVEEKFYLIAPFLALYLQRLRRSWALGLLLGVATLPMLAGVVWLHYWQPMSYGDYFWTLRTPFHFAVAAILMGLAVAYMKNKGIAPRLLRERGRAALRLALLVILLLFAAGEWFSPFQDMSSRQWMSGEVVLYLLSLLYATLVLCCVLDARLSQGLLGSRPLRYVARISYALYLSHYAVIPLAVHLTQGLGERLALTQTVQAGLFLPVFVGAALALALLMHLLVEKPFLLWRDRQSGKPGPR